MLPLTVKFHQVPLSPIVLTVNHSTVVLGKLKKERFPLFFRIFYGLKMVAKVLQQWPRDIKQLNLVKVSVSNVFTSSD